MNIAIIPARGGSKRIPNKNRRMFHGKPILAYSIEAAMRSGLFGDEIFVSTEDERIANAAQEFGARIIARPPELAEIGAPDCGTQEVTRHALEALGIADGFACCIYPCAPLMTAEDLRWAFERVQDEWRQSFVYVKGWYYFGRVEWFLERREFNRGQVSILPARYVDIDEPADWARAEAMYAALHAQSSVGIR